MRSVETSPAGLTPRPAQQNQHQIQHGTQADHRRQWRASARSWKVKCGYVFPTFILVNVVSVSTLALAVLSQAKHGFVKVPGGFFSTTNKIAGWRALGGITLAIYPWLLLLAYGKILVTTTQRQAIAELCSDSSKPPNVKISTLSDYTFSPVSSLLGWNASHKLRSASWMVLVICAVALSPLAQNVFELTVPSKPVAFSTSDRGLHQEGVRFQSDSITTYGCIYDCIDLQTSADLYIGLKGLEIVKHSENKLWNTFVDTNLRLYISITIAAVLVALLLLMTVCTVALMFHALNTDLPPIEDLLESLGKGNLLDRVKSMGAEAQLHEILKLVHYSTDEMFESKWDGARTVHFTPSSAVPRPQLMDRCKERIELFLGSDVYWWPLRQGDRICLPGKTRISWRWAGRELHVDVTSRTADIYRSSCVPVSQAMPSSAASSSSSASGLSQNEPLKNPTSPPKASQHNPGSTGTSNRQGSSDPNSTVHSVGTKSARQQDPAVGNVYWCIDSCWRQPVATQRCEIDTISIDDQTLFSRLSSKYAEVRGLRGRLLSLKCCVAVEFIKFAFVFPRQDRVSRICAQLPKRPNCVHGCTPSCADKYEYSMRSNDEVHRKIASVQIIEGMRDPRLTNQICETLVMIPKHTAQVPGWSACDEAWGLHGVEGFSLWKVMCWLGVLTVIGIGFVVAWLVYIDKTDLQNAFTVPMFLMTMVALALAVPQYWSIA